LTRIISLHTVTGTLMELTVVRSLTLMKSTNVTSADRTASEL